MARTNVGFSLHIVFGRIWEDNTMGRLVPIGLLTLAAALGQTPIVAADDAQKDMAARIEVIPVQTLTISDEQFLKGDAYGRPTTIAGMLRIAQGSGRLPAAQVALMRT
jgi:hypothetical protein